MKKEYFRQVESVVFGLLVIFSIVHWAGSFALAQIPGVEGQHEGVSLHSRTLIAPSDRSQALDAVKQIPNGLRKHMIIQLDWIPDATERKILEESGIKLLQYIQNHGWYASVSGGLDTSLPLLNQVRASWSMESGDRVDSRVKEGRIPDHAIADDGSYVLKATAFADVDLENLKKEIEECGGKVDSVSVPFSVLFLHVPKSALQEITDLDEIQLIEPTAPPLEPEMYRARGYLHTDLVQAAPYNLTGAGVVVSVEDEGYAFQHQDFYSRWMKGDNDPLPISRHATMTAGTIAGDGTFNSMYKGMAPGAMIITYAAPVGVVGSEANLYGDIADILTRGVAISNNSWGYGGCVALPWGDYTSQARVFDLEARGTDSSGNAIGNPTVVVFSAGNERNNTACVANNTAPYANYGSINQPKPAKNPIIVGAVDSYLNDMMSAFSSWGPTSDGRLKPDIVAAGLHNGINMSGVSGFSNDSQYGSPPLYIDGDFYRAPAETNTNDPGTTYDDRYGWFGMTSAAAAMVSGNAALFIQDFRAQNSNSNPLPSTVKAHFIHTARDLSDSTGWYNPGPDYASGYGVLDIKAAIDQLRSKGWVEGCVGNGETDTYRVSIPAETSQVKVTLAWDDAPASPGTTAPALVNDLDLVVTDASATRRYPWTLNPAAPSADAVRTAEDHLNNVEMVLADGTVPSGLWTVKVRGTSVPSGPQCYSLIYSPVVPLPDWTETAISSPPTLAPSGGSFGITDTVKNLGPGDGPTSTTRFYLQTGTVYTQGLGPIGYRTVPALAAGAALASKMTVTIPNSFSAGSYYLWACANDCGDKLLCSKAPANAEFSRDNNCRRSSTTVSVIPLVTPGTGLTSSGNQGGPFSPASITYTLHNPSSISINWTVAKTQTWTTLSKTGGTLAANSTDTVTVSINSNANSLAAGSYNDTVSFTNVTNGIGNTTRSVSLTVNPLSQLPTVTVTATDATATEAGATTGTYHISRTGSTTASLSVYFAMSGTATNGTDYNAITSPVTIAAGASYADITLTPINDTIVEGNETAILTLSANAAYTVGSPSSATITILDDDTPWPILDNLPAGQSDASRSFTGTWCASGVTGYYGVDSLYSCGSGTDTYRWMPNIPAAGTYNVYIWYTSSATRSTSVPVSVTYAEGTATKTFNEQTGGGQWVLHGTYNFNAGTGGYVQVSDVNGLAVADAVRFELSSGPILSVTPADGLTATGPKGGPFSPSSKTYTLQNTGSGSMAWTAAWTQTWTSVSSASGTLAGGASTTVTVSINSNANSLAAGSYSDTVGFTNTVNGTGNTSRPVSLTVSPPGGDIILDNAPAGQSDASRSFTGTWCASGVTGYYGADSLYSCGSGTDTYRWTPTIPAAGTYNVYIWYTSSATRSTSVPVSVTHAAGTTTKTFNEQTGGGQWVLHGTYSFNAGTGGYVQVSDVNGLASADAVKFHPVTGPTPIIVDNALAGQSDASRSFTGTWCMSGATGYYGTDSLYSCGSGTDTYRWTPTIPSAGTYNVYIWYSSSGTRSTSVPVSVTYAGGTATKTFNEQAGGGQWVLHGTYSFNAGTGGYVQVSDVNGLACADAVKFEPTQ